ncbi:hypothetical protein IMG5_056150 [Ichthyophthirius multifiliis]|uniref:Ethanolaminephosphotransferase n=1 Tax=Ichthyophthirius multifiliis TaxID=5932 RepID=G0QN80_ICHMU|nr:hypothetical protein IMG5_056150 [Ichthyophthirius multifiliis]EGR33317.1 hypothetical protein IMG5_056150 [Ichthyophthirius multifiliis]|eukprot:XP_004037303.1 hypothetical protein IMG5_056150 [Ichthyophthirius multifiliis]
MAYIDQDGLKELENYKYFGGEYSWLDKKMNPFWLWCSELLPKTLAPNTVTFIGFAFVVSQYVVMLVYDVTLTRELPSWVFLWAAFCSFIYQTLDAVDGKQARRTGTSSPLGQLFDHGCDSFSVTFFLLGVAQAVKMHPQYIFYLLVIVSQFWSHGN